METMHSPPSGSIQVSHQIGAHLVLRNHMIAVTISQHSFPVLQASPMDRNLFRNFKIPLGSFSIFGILTLTVWVTLYDRILVPHLSKYTPKPRGIGVQQRIGIGLFISCMATAAAAMVERTGRNRAIEDGFLESPKAQVNMLAMWLIPQHCLTGLAEAFNVIGQIELYYSQFPNSMGTIAVALFSLAFAIGNLVAHCDHCGRCIQKGWERELGFK